MSKLLLVCVCLAFLVLQKETMKFDAVGGGGSLVVKASFAGVAFLVNVSVFSMLSNDTNTTCSVPPPPHCIGSID